MTFPRIGITLGDPGGIGPEITLKALASQALPHEADFTLIGSKQAVERMRQRLDMKLDITSFTLVDTAPSSETIVEGHPSKGGGRISFQGFKQAVQMAEKKELQAIVTAPISKYSWSLAEIPWVGHTEYLESIYPQAVMCFFSKKLRVALFSHHIPLEQALQKVKKSLLQEFFLHLHDTVGTIFQQEYQYLVAGLNPHAGEKGLLGKEEEREILPAIEFARKKGMSIEGPFPPDTIFIQAKNKPDKFVISLYHDQGLIAFKLMAFEDGVNTTLGLPFIRTSPDHGTAFDIAGKGLANPQSLIQAIKLAHKLADAC